ncbi:MAG: GNAT family N-acetyltransferase, partial [Planctomycetota bacterium]
MICCPERRVVAAILVRIEDDRQFVVEPVMVHPENLRLGFGHYLLLAAILLLKQLGVEKLVSRCQLSNLVSLQWHVAVGFREVPTRFCCGHRAMHHLWMAE